MDIFERKNIKPMLIGEVKEPFNDPDYIYELKLDGERCIAYIDKSVTDLRSKRNNKMLIKVPELSEINKCVSCRCILDGELIVFKDGKPNFSEIQRRTVTTNAFKIQLAANSLPATFTVFDVLYYKDQDITNLPLIKRKKLLHKIIDENERIAISRYIEEYGIEFYKLTEQNQLEGIVAKDKNSKYYFGKRTKDWIKIKNYIEEDYVISGYAIKRKGAAAIFISQYNAQGELIYKGNVILGTSTPDFKIIISAPINKKSDNAVWINPVLTCTVQYMMKSAKGGLRQPMYKCLGNKKPAECTEETLS